ncbi:unnamed protein product [Brugia timori]|uniref:Uncharacterized protein n=1 Tax=Brugia timori TaxID=42155 RepID=A0A0R3QDV4_9BILA|nr:unnamed protein product [Brugia timori]
MRYLVCTTDASPCPPADVQAVTFAETVDLSAMGVTPEMFLKVYGMGFGAVFAAFVMGWVLGIALGLIRKA